MHCLQLYRYGQDGPSQLRPASGGQLVVPSGVFRGTIGPWPPFGQIFSTIGKIGKHGLPHCASISDQQKFAPPPLLKS